MQRGKKKNEELIIVCNVIRGNTKHMTNAEIEAMNRARSVKGDTSRFDRENNLLKDLDEMFPKRIEIVNLG